MIPLRKMTEKVCVFSRSYQLYVPEILIWAMVAVSGFTDSPLRLMTRICIIAPWLSISPLYRDFWKQISLHCLTHSTMKKVFIYFWLKCANDSLHAVISWVHQQNANLLVFVRYSAYFAWARTLLLPLCECFLSPLKKDENIN